MRINRYCKLAYLNAKKHGFHEKEQDLVHLELIKSEVNEAIDAYLRNDFSEEFKKDSFEDELADVVIRVFDYCGYHNIDLEKHIKAKMEYNIKRPYLHGKGKESVTV